MAEQTTQTWAKRIRSKPDFNTYEKQTNKGRRAKSQLQNEKKLHITNLFAEKPYTTTDEVIDSLSKGFEGFSLKKPIVNSFILHKCNLSVKRLVCHSVDRNDETHIDVRYEWDLK